MASAARLRRQWPEFDDKSEYPDALVDDFLGWAAEQMDPNMWGKTYEQAVVALAAHLLALRDNSKNGQSQSGPVVSEKTLGASISYADVASESRLDETIYGREHKRLKKSAKARAPTVFTT